MIATNSIEMKDYTGRPVVDLEHARKKYLSKMNIQESEESEETYEEA